MPEPVVIVTVPTLPTVRAQAVELPRVIVSGTSGSSADAPSAIVPAVEPLSGGDFVAFTDAGAVLARADNVSRVAVGFVRSAYSIGESALVYSSGRNSGLLGLVPGTVYYLSPRAPGKPSESPNPRGTHSEFAQRIGVAADATTLVVNISQPIFTP